MNSEKKFKVQFPEKKRLIDLTPRKPIPSQKEIVKFIPQEKNYHYFENTKKNFYEQPIREKALCAYKENGNGKEYYEVIGLTTNIIYYKTKN